MMDVYRAVVALVMILLFISSYFIPALRPLGDVLALIAGMSAYHLFVRR